MPPELLSVEGLTLTRAGRTILRNVNLSVGRGEIHALWGMNGSGKSSLAYAIMGCSDYTPDAGHIVFDGRGITALAIHERARLGMTLAWQEPARVEGLTVSDYLSLGLSKPDGGRMEAALAAVALMPARYLGRPVDKTLSGGERKRIEVAAVYAMHARLAILDEPDSGIDVLSLDDIMHLMQYMMDDDITVREAMRLNGIAARGLAKTRIAVRGRARSRVFMTAEGNTPEARGHMDCTAIVRDEAVAENVPRVVRHDRAQVTHEAAVGTVNRKELETLMARGLDEETAADVIVRGTLGR